MKRMNRLASATLALSTLACAMLAGTAMGSTSGLANQPTPFYVRYFDQAMPLYLEPGALAIRTPAYSATSIDGWTDALAHELGALGVLRDEGQMVGVGGFVRARLRDAGLGIVDQELTLRNAVAELADDGRFDFVSPVFMDDRGMPYIITDEIIVGLRDDVDHAAALAAFADNGLSIVQQDLSGMAGVYLLRSSSRNGFDVLDLANTLGERGDVLFSEPNAVVRGENFLVPNDPMFNQQWALHQNNNIDMNGPQAWDISTGNSSIITVVLDVGMQYEHPDLNNAPGQDFAGSIPNGGPANSCDNHGTAVAGCISAIINNNTGIVGGAPGTRTASAKIGTSISIFGFCLGNFDSQPTMLTNALNWSVTTGARVTNSSFSYGNSAAVTNAYASTRAQGLIHFAATGNGGNNSISYPANLPSINAIGAINSSGSLASFSQYGTGIFCVAPGEAVLSTDRTGSAGYASGDYATVDGTSFASPYAASVAALILSINPNLTVAEVENIISSSCIDMGAIGYDTTYGWGRANLYGAATMALATLPVELSCGEPAAGSCCEPNGTPYCDDADCCAMICAADPYCCTNEWDDICAEAALSSCVHCMSCGSAFAGSCCVEHSTPFCDDALCCASICALDPYCCNNEWDDICAEAAMDSANCGQCTPMTGACCLGGTTCIVVSESQCLTGGGVYHGDESQCIQISCSAPLCDGDLNGDGVVNADDLSVMLSGFGCTGGCDGDLNGDGLVDADDLSLMLSSFGCTS